MCRAIVQLSGDALVCDQAAFRSAAMQSENLISKVMRHEQTSFAQAQQSTACMANHEIEARLCRWMLRARDLSGSDQLPFTQEVLADMLGVRRTSVTTVARTLQEAGMVKYTSRRIEILDVEGLREGACECYETVKEQYDQLLGVPPSELRVGSQGAVGRVRTGVRSAPISRHDKGFGGVRLRANKRPWK
jgi:hypothetical protein